MDINMNRLRMLRTKKGLTQETVAEMVGVSRQALAKWEKGETLPDIDSCLRLADLYEMPLDLLVRSLKEEKNADNRHLIGYVKVNDKGQITLPAPIREAFQIEQGNYMLVLADTDRGIALINLGSMAEDGTIFSSPLPEKEMP